MSGTAANIQQRGTALHFKTYVALAFIITLAPLGNVLLSKGMKGIAAATTWQPNELLSILGQILSSPYIWLGIGAQLAFFVVYMVVLSWADYSYVQPACAFSYAVVALLGYLLLGELVNPLRAAGIAVISAGVIVVGRTAPRTTDPIQAIERALEQG
jgi:drug/metabolite transporter (DMT)-like permease